MGCHVGLPHERSECFGYTSFLGNCSCIALLSYIHVPIAETGLELCHRPTQINALGRDKYFHNATRYKVGLVNDEFKSRVFFI